jgi:hypothetical protein
MMTWNQIRKSKEWKTITKQMTAEEKEYFISLPVCKMDSFVQNKLSEFGFSVRVKSSYI